MSYTITAFHPDVRAQALAGKELDEFEHTPLASATVADLRSRLSRYGYVLKTESDQVVEYLKMLDGCPIEVSIFDTEVSFSVPYWEDSDEAIVEAIQDASELFDAQDFGVYNAQFAEADRWSDSE